MEESFGVKLLLEVDHYRKSERSAKYGLLFIAFTYPALLFLEISSRQRIHLFHYSLVSLSLNEFAYLTGNIGLFIALGAIMWLSAKTDLFRKSGI